MGGRRTKPRETPVNPQTAADAAGVPGHRMTAARIPAGREALEPCIFGRALEELVWTVAALDGTRTEELLSGLDERLRSRALGLLRRLECSSRSDRHGRLADAFTLQAAPGRTAEGIPGPLGIEVRRGLALPLPGSSGPLARWARRLMLEIGAS
jgi:hypothetical protein